MAQETLVPETQSLSQHPSLSDRVYDVLRNSIVSGESAPGARLEVVELARKFEVSRSPVTDALNRLTGEGLVVDIPRRGYFVSNLDQYDVADLLEARLVLDLGAAERYLSSVLPEHLDEMRRLLAELQRFIDDHGHCVDYSLFMERDASFHRVLVHSSRNPHLIKIYTSLCIDMHSVRLATLGRMDDKRMLPTIREHTAIVDALESQDLIALKNALTAHALNAAASFRELKKSMVGR